LIDPETGTKTVEFKRQNENFGVSSSISLSADGQRIAVSEDASVRIYDRAGTLRKSLN